MELGIEQIQNSKTVMEELNTSIMHGIYVSNMAYLLSKEIGLSEEQCYELAVAGMLHDIGKIRASKLMYVEQPDHNFVIKQINYLRRHPFLGYDLLKNKG